jgi:hypothetical protein
LNHRSQNSWVLGLSPSSGREHDDLEDRYDVTGFCKLLVPKASGFSNSSHDSVCVGKCFGKDVRKETRKHNDPQKQNGKWQLHTDTRNWMKERSACTRRIAGQSHGRRDVQRR